MKWVGKILNFLIPVLSAVLGLLAANSFNLFSMLPFVPEESAFEICITVYFAITDLLISELISFAKRRIGKIRSQVEVLVSMPQAEAALNTHPTILFNREGTSEMWVYVHMTGKKKHFKDIKISICDVGFITLQPSVRTQGVSIAENGDYIIDLYAITGNASIIEVSQRFRIVMQENIPDGSRTMLLKPNISNQNLWIKYICNYATIKVEEH